MNRFFSLAVLGLVLGGCAADFSEERSPDTTTAPESSEQTTDTPTVQTYGGELQRPAETIGTVEEAATAVHSRAIHNYMERVEQADTELGPQFNRSITQ
jgi:hypothetical protein